MAEEKKKQEKESKPSNVLVFIEAKMIDGHQYCLGDKLQEDHLEFAFKESPSGEKILKPFLCPENRLTAQKEADIKKYREQLVKAKEAAKKKLQEEG